MTDQDGPDQSLARTNHDTTGNSLTLSETKSLQLDGLTEEQTQELRMQFNSGMIDVAKKAAELQVDVGALDAALGTMASQTAEVSKAGDSITVTHPQSTSLGRTEVIMGNTDNAAKGKLSKSQTGEADHTLWYVLIAAIVIIIIAAVIFG